jgi:hypothetical protein
MRLVMFCVFRLKSKEFDIDDKFELSLNLTIHTVLDQIVTLQSRAFVELFMRRKEDKLSSQL